MKRFTAIRILSSCLSENDIALFAGRGICQDAFKYHREGNLYLDELKSPSSVAVGLANGTDKKVFIFCEDYKFLEDLSSAAQMAASGCKNIFYVIIKSGYYIKNMPTIFDSLTAPKGMLFNMGFIVHNYDSQLRISKSYKEIKAIWSRSKGPLAAFVSVDFTPNDSSKIIKNDIKSFIEFVENKTLGTSMIEDVNHFDLGEVVELDIAGSG
jgi:hypothetical protein